MKAGCTLVRSRPSISIMKHTRSLPASHEVSEHCSSSILRLSNRLKKTIEDELKRAVLANSSVREEPVTPVKIGCCTLNMAGNSNNARKSSAFLSLPYEIRHKIYKEMVPVRQTIFVAGPMASYEDAAPTDSFHFIMDTRLKNLLASCRAINEDVSNLFYGYNIFYMNIEQRDTHPIAHQRRQLFFMNLRPKTARKIRKLRIFVGLDVPPVIIPTCSFSLASFPTVEISFESFSSLAALKWGYKARRLGVIEQVYRQIVQARPEGETVFDDRVDAETSARLRSVQPAADKSALASDQADRNDLLSLGKLK